MTGQPKRRGITLVVVAVVAGALLLGVFAFRAWQTSSADRDICREIEAVKALIREDARDDWRNLDRNLKILRIKKTKEIVDIARESRDRKLDRFGKRDCNNLPSLGGTP